MRPSVRFVNVEDSWSETAGFAFGPIHWMIDRIDLYAKTVTVHTFEPDGRYTGLSRDYGVNRGGYAHKIACIKTPAQLVDEATEIGKLVGVTISKDAHLAMYQAVPMIVSHHPDDKVPLIGWQCWTVQHDKNNAGRIEFTRQHGIKKRIDYPVAISVGGHVMIPLKAIRDTIMDEESLGRLADPLAGVDEPRDQRKLILKGRW